MSKNSPTFLQNLLVFAKIENEQEIARSLTRFLRYHPINEFEPFFESLGLKQTEISPLLPRNLMFLSDDDVLLGNFHVLCNYGIPRSKIGKMYKEEKEIFRYDYGVLASKLRAYEELGLSKPTVIKLVTCCPSLLIGGVKGEFVRVLEELKDLGVEHDWIRKCLSDKNAYDWNRMLGMLGFLSKMGCGKKDFRWLIAKHHGVLFNNNGRKFYVIVALLLKVGLKMHEILALLLQYPRVLVGNFAKNLWQSVHFLYEIGMETEDIAKIVRNYPQVLGSCSPKTPKVILSKLNIELKNLCDIIKEDPYQLSKLASRSKISFVQVTDEAGMYLLEKTNFLLKLGFVENSDEMAKALKQFRGRGDQLQERFDCLVGAGLDCHDVSNMIKAAPPVLNQSKDVIEMKINYLVNCLGYPLQSVVAFPTYLCYDLERIKLRFSMYGWMKEKGAVKPRSFRNLGTEHLALSTILACSELRFVKYLVSLHPEGPEVWERLKKTQSSS
ncbi:transcription termination factor MTEF18, mitochondrial-like isoform X2 [Tasmannia lanceolata]